MRESVWTLGAERQGEGCGALGVETLLRAEEGPALENQSVIC